MIKIINYTKNPISHIGEIAGVCWGSDTSAQEKNYKRGLECIKANHGRVMEYADVEFIIDEYSARVIREWYTHRIGNTNLQQSTRYVNCKDFNYYTPDSIKKDKHTQKIYDNCMDLIKVTYEQLLLQGVPKEDIANILPLGMETKIVSKFNLRALIHLFETRQCNRAYIEFRELLKEFKQELSKLDDEWKYLCENEFKIICDKTGVCKETNGCGRHGQLKSDNK